MARRTGVEYDSLRDRFRLPTTKGLWVIVPGEEVRMALNFACPQSGMHLAAVILRVADAGRPLR